MLWFDNIKRLGFNLLPGFPDTRPPASALFAPVKNKGAYNDEDNNNNEDDGKAALLADLSIGLRFKLLV